MHANHLLSLLFNPPPPPPKTAELDWETANMFKKELTSRVVMLEIIQYTLLGVGLSIFLLCLVGCCMVGSHSGGKIA